MNPSDWDNIAKIRMKQSACGTGNPSPTGRNPLLHYVGDGFPVPKILIFS